VIHKWSARWILIEFGIESFSGPEFHIVICLVCCILTFIHYRYWSSLTISIISTAAHHLDRLVLGLIIFAKNVEKLNVSGNRWYWIIFTSLIILFIVCIYLYHVIISIIYLQFASFLYFAYWHSHAIFIGMTILQIEAGLLQKKYVAKVIALL
jgi:hypothetical protein